MKTRIKKLLSLALAVIMIVSCIFTTALTASADSYLAEPYYAFDFEDGKTAHTGTYFAAERTVITEEDGNKAFSIKAGANAYTTFPAKFTVGKEYTVSFKYKIAACDFGSVTDPKFAIGIKSAKRGGSPYTDITGMSWIGISGPDTEYRTFTNTFTFTDKMLNSDNEYLMIAFEKSTGSGTFEYVVDNIVVKETGGTVAFNTNGGSTVASVKGYPGQVLDIKAPTKNECIFAGWYSDAECTQKVDSIIVPEKGVTTTLYAGWEVINHYYFDFEDGKTAFTGTYYNATRQVVTEDGNKAFSITANGNAFTTFPAQFEVGKEYIISYDYKLKDYTADSSGNFKYGIALSSTPRTGGNVGTLIETNIVEPTAVDTTYKSRSKTFTFKESMLGSNNANYFQLALYKYSGSSYELLIDNISIRETGGTVAFETNGGNTISSVTGYPGQVVELPTPKYNGYKFLGWYLDEDLTQIAENVKVPAVGETVTLYADWELITKIDFEDGKESILAKYPAYTNYTSSVIADGDNSLNLNITEKSVVTFPIKLEAGKTYKYSFDYKLTDLEKKDENVAFKINMEIDAAGSDGYPGYPSKQVALPWSWKTFNNIMDSYATQSGTFTVGDEMSGYFAFYFTLAGNNASTGLNLDNISVVEMPKPATPVAPTIASVKGNTVTLNTVAGCEYRLNGGTWQSSPVFKGMLQGVELNFTQRVKATSDALASDESAVLIHTTALSGDADNDGVINAYDLVVSRQVLLGENVGEISIDANADGFVDARDIVNLKKYLANVTETTVMVVDNVDIKGFKVYSDSALITTQARDELIEVINAREEGLVEAVDEIGENKNVITLVVDFEMAETEYILTVKNGTIEIKAGSDYALLDAVRLFASVLNNIDESLIRLENGYTIAGEYVGLAYEGAIQKKNI